MVGDAGACGHRQELPELEVREKGKPLPEIAGCKLISFHSAAVADQTL